MCKPTSPLGCKSTIKAIEAGQPEQQEAIENESKHEQEQIQNQEDILLQSVGIQVDKIPE